MRNNKPVAALISPDRYQDLLEKEEDLQLLEMALARQGKDSALTTREDFLKEMGISTINLYLSFLKLKWNKYELGLCIN